MTREDVGIVLDFLNLTENEFLTAAFLIPIGFMMWGAAFYFTSRFIFMGVNLWKTTEKANDGEDNKRGDGLHFPR